VKGRAFATRANGDTLRNDHFPLYINDRKRAQTPAEALDLWSIFGHGKVAAMAGTVRHARLESRSARDRLKRGRQPHWQALEDGKVHLGWQRWKGQRGEAGGRWVLRRYIGNNKYRSETLGRADDAEAADGERILTFEQAEIRARTRVTTGGGKIERLTVRQAMTLYTDYKRSRGQSVKDLMSRTTAHILPELGDYVVAELTAAQLRGWLATMAASPAQHRPTREGMPQYKAAPGSDEDLRRRRASANRVLTMLKAALNHAFDEGHISNRDAWGRKLKPFEDVEVARVRYLNVGEVRRLINAADADFRPLARAALETGCRYGELTRLEVADFHVTRQRQEDGEPVEVGTVTIRQSKTGKPRHVALTEVGTAFFREHCAGRSGLMFTHSDGTAWRKSDQARPMRAACVNARIAPAVGFHQLRHTWASLAVQAGMPLMVVAKNLGHVDTGMVEKHYGHLTPSFITKAIRDHAPVYGIKEPKRVVTFP
jgi:integrase